ncbi:MAG: hypothetical protein EOT05_00855 [Candidatus Microsaccharimonas sossegonensis]|uniref:Uncharacterized protein n=1 Tax=Candidatus Microsaccharimonas sossegonensis TaxID=2506948 RepID=A0A4Q0AH60_9BACT|nr:MAG: hypothetical protein EOT05_00855 [Candidatus Microsaccharimonas sossegonensis]
MTDDPTPTSEVQLSFLDKHRFLLLIMGTILVAMVLVSLSVAMYKISGASQLDLSRPGYQSVSDKVNRTDPITDYSSFGPVNKTTVNDFMKLYDKQSANAKAVDAFNGDPLNPDVLDFSNPTVTVE